MEAEKAGASLDSLIAGFNSRISELQELAIARNMYPASSVTDLTSVDAAVKAMELQVQAIKDRVRDETLAIPKEKVVPFLSLYDYMSIGLCLISEKFYENVDISVCEVLIILIMFWVEFVIIVLVATWKINLLSELESKRSNFDYLFISRKLSAKQWFGFGTFKLEKDPAPPPKEKKGRSTPPLWFRSAEELECWIPCHRCCVSTPWWVSIEKRGLLYLALLWRHFLAQSITNCIYMRGRLTLEKVNTAINDMATYAEANYQLIAAPKKNVAGDRLEKALVLRHLGRVSETRIGHHQVIILLKPH
ncbi:putative spindle and kinetochore-associated protein [Rosa chinensis]|uniref:Putative spindle and kinetochore-associated protein n=1 Tax=Rosa chinensis TaxID=74649 RepID=A0A2P6SFR3_ROSCH|nr:putative spindle and kinetochore-associated protein [Rosa chinensis]